jgi:hypothetical protein
MKQVVIASLPYVETSDPLMAPALLKGVVNKTGKICIAMDLNIESIHEIKKLDEKIGSKVKNWFLIKENTDCKDTIDAVNKLVDYCFNRIIEQSPVYVCLSLFCNTSYNFNLMLCKRLKEYRPDIKIVLGGSGIYADNRTKKPYAKILLNAKIIDYYIVGDGEEPLYDLLTADETPEGINKNEFNTLENLSVQPFADYDDYNWDLYEIKRIPMYGSRGCVRRCSFCDVYKIWKKFKLRPISDVLDEMKYQAERTGITDFYFRDSLINGSISEYRKFISLLTEHNSKSEKKLTWNSFFIFRPQNQMTEEDWKMTGQSGVTWLTIGVESLIERIRLSMKKKFTNEDLDFSIKMAKKYNVKLQLLLIVGYVNETEEDHLEAMQWLRDNSIYAGDPIIDLSFGGTLVITDLTDLYDHANDHNVILGSKPHLWINKTIALDYETRLRRKNELNDLATQLGFILGVTERPVI